MTPSPRVALIVLLAMLFLTSSAMAADANVTVQPWGPTQVQTFDPTKPPGTPADPAKPGDLPGPPVDEDGKPLIPATEDAVAVARLQQTFDIGTSPPDAGGQVTVTDVNITLAGHTDIYLPVSADQQ